MLPFAEECVLDALKLLRCLGPLSELQEFVSLALSSDGKYLAAQTGGPDWTLALWVWDKGKLVATARTISQSGQTVTQCLFQTGARKESSCLFSINSCWPCWLPQHIL